ncbi:thioredoxin-related transmembrane protein 2 homolog [Patella vulgata]|uniref:thioredoxin-related transmembrane protein 2 homolog n=1 Tax=Patella vulgata TaxID=6465 RepID=UPI00217F8DE1|nr:thioredoxin-related transmembrane protein 2 homolog [Patella vulgata]
MGLNELLYGTRTLLTPHHATNIFLALAYFILKTTPFVCTYLFYDCTLALQEWEWITFLGCVIVLKTKKLAYFVDYIHTACLFSKMLNTVMFFKANPMYGTIYGGLCILHFIFLPEPSYAGPDYITYFRGPHLEEELERDRRITWVVAFYAAWSPPCVTFAPIFSQISNEYHLDNLRFGKMDITKFPIIAEKFKVDCTSWSRQLPTVILFEGGKEKMRRPLSKGKQTIKFTWTKESVIQEFDMNQIYGDCKKHPLSKQKKEN